MTALPRESDDRMKRIRPNEKNLPSEALMLTTDGLARLLNCSPRSIRRLADQGNVPRPVKIGGMVRWPRGTIEKWCAEGCPAVTMRRKRR